MLIHAVSHANWTKLVPNGTKVGKTLVRPERTHRVLTLNSVHRERHKKKRDWWSYFIRTRKATSVAPPPKKAPLSSYYEGSRFASVCDWHSPLVNDRGGQAGVANQISGGGCHHGIPAFDYEAELNLFSFLSPFPRSAWYCYTETIVTVVIFFFFTF